MTTLRAVRAEDLAAVNELILAAIDTWALAAGVRARIAPSYCYDAMDLEHMRLFARGEPVEGMIALEAAAPTDAPALPALLLHGIFVQPALHGRGLGRELVADARAIARDEGAHGLVVKARPDANGFFEALGFDRLAVSDPARDYPYRWWLELDPPD